MADRTKFDAGNHQNDADVIIKRYLLPQRNVSATVAKAIQEQYIVWSKSMEGQTSRLLDILKREGTGALAGQPTSPSPEMTPEEVARAMSER